VTEDGGASAGGDDFAVLLQHHADQAQVQAVHRGQPVAQDEHGAGGVIGDSVGQLDLPVSTRLSTISRAGMTPAVEASTSATVIPGPTRSLLSRKANLTLTARLDQPLGWDGLSVQYYHVVQQVPVVGLVDAHHLLHGLAGQANFLAYHPPPARDSGLDDGQLDLIRLEDGQVREALGQGINRDSVGLGTPAARRRGPGCRRNQP